MTVKSNGPSESGRASSPRSRSSPRRLRLVEIEVGGDPPRALVIARRRAISLLPPIMIGGPPGCTGRGWASTPAKSTYRPWNSALHRPQRAHRREVLVGASGALVQRDAERGELGRGTPRRRRPPDAHGDLVHARQLLGEQHGLVQRSSRMPVATVIDVVFAAASASATTASRNGISGAIA